MVPFHRDNTYAGKTICGKFLGRPLDSFMFEQEEPNLTMVPFKYVDFYDVPRLIMFTYQGQLFLLASYFDKERDDHDENIRSDSCLLGLSRRSQTRRGRSWRKISAASCSGKYP